MVDFVPQFLLRQQQLIALQFTTSLPCPHYSDLPPPARREPLTNAKFTSHHITSYASAYLQSITHLPISRFHLHNKQISIINPQYSILSHTVRTVSDPSKSPLSRRHSRSQRLPFEIAEILVPAIFPALGCLALKGCTVFYSFPGNRLGLSW